jgi:hypothetical protein
MNEKDVELMWEEFVNYFTANYEKKESQLLIFSDKIKIYYAREELRDFLIYYK